MSIYSRKAPVRTRIIPSSQRIPSPIITGRGVGLINTLLRNRTQLSAYSGRLPIRTRIIPQSMRSRPTAIIPIRPGIIMPTSPGTRMRARPDINIAGILPTIVPIPSAQAGGGLPTPSVTGGGLGLGLEEIGGDIKAFGGNILDQFKALIPTAIKIIAAVIIIKIVLWLIKGRGR